MVEKKPFVSICIPLYERDEWFDKLIKSIEDHDAGIDYEICLGEGKRSCVANRNIAQRKANSNYICQLDGDAEITQDGWLRTLYDTLTKTKNAGIVGCIIEKPEGGVDHCGAILVNNKKYTDERIQMVMSGMPDYYANFLKDYIDGNTTFLIDYTKNEKLHNKVYKVFQCSGVCFLYDKRNTGLFCEKKFIKAGWEDVDFMANVCFSGLEIYVDGNVRIKHPNHVRTKEEHQMRDKAESERGFSGNNLLKYMLRSGVI